MPYLDRDKYNSQEAYFLHLVNDLGAGDLSIAYFDGNAWSRWFNFLELQHKNRTDIIWKGITVEEFYEKVNNRSVLDIELIYDFDEDESGSQDPIKIKEYAKKSIKILNSAGIFGEAYFSGSKSIHYSVLIPKLRDLSKRQREEFKQRALAPLNKHNDFIFKADLSKKSERTMIALEGQFHWKTGKIKRKVDLENE